MAPLSSAPEWGVLLKATIAPDVPGADDERLAALLDRLPGEDKRLTGGGHDFTVAFWLEAPDAVRATSRAAALVRDVAGRLGIADLRFIRSHAASVEGRAPVLPVDDARRAAADTWAVDIKVGLPRPDRPATAETLRAIEEVLVDLGARATLHGDVEKLLLDDGSGLTVRCWATGETLEAALLGARARLRAALDGMGLPGATIERVKAWSPAALAADTFTGATARTPRATDELR